MEEVSTAVPLGTAGAAISQGDEVRFVVGEQTP